MTAPIGRDEAGFPWPEDAAPAPHFAEPRPHFEGQVLCLMLSQLSAIYRGGYTGSCHHGGLGVGVEGVRARKRCQASIESMTGRDKEDASLTLDLAVRKWSNISSLVRCNRVSQAFGSNFPHTCTRILPVVSYFKGRIEPQDVHSSCTSAEVKGTRGKLKGGISAPSPSLSGDRLRTETLAERPASLAVGSNRISISQSHNGRRAAFSLGDQSRLFSQGEMYKGARGLADDEDP